MKKIGLFWRICFCLCCSLFYAQNANSQLRISIITCAPGDELYSIFGHTAIRIIDSTGRTDLVYNYGTFDFEDPDFYVKFVRGKLNYFLSVSDFPSFMYEYQVTHRSVTEQELLLNDSTQKNIQYWIDQNMLGNNRYYKYDFLYDNCTSRVKDILIKKGGMQINHSLVANGTSFRDMIHEYLDKGGMSWTKLGMDILLGSPSDKAVSINESMFLPDYLLKGIDSSAISAHSLLYKKQSILIAKKSGKVDHTNWPVIVFSLLCALILGISFINHEVSIKLTLLFDSILLGMTGLIGILLLFTWFGTDHSSFANNYNLLWALPANLFAALAILKRPRWLAKYFLFITLLYGLLLIGWYWLPQSLHPAFIPITLLLFLRSARLAKR